MAKIIAPKAEKKEKKVGTISSTSKVKVKAVQVQNKDKVIVRNGYKIYFLSPSTDEKLVNDLVNTGKIIDSATISVVTPNDKSDEIVLIVRD